jgi:hypothetical protein
MTDIDLFLERFAKQHSVLLDALPEAQRHCIYCTLRCQDALDADLAALGVDVLSSDAVVGVAATSSLAAPSTSRAPLRRSRRRLGLLQS